MKYFFIKLNYAVEIGARLAYQGHYRRTGDWTLIDIASDELNHQIQLGEILRTLGEKPSDILCILFTIIGTTIGFLCRFSPEFLLNHVARLMEKFAIINYSRLAKIYPEYATEFLEIHDAEKRHEQYFTGTLKKADYQVS